MKVKQIALLLIVTLLTGSLFLLIDAQQTAAQTGPNLLTNPGFENGHYNQDDIAEITVPNGWRMHWVDAVTFPLAYNGLVAHRPETVVWNAAGGIPDGEEVFWRDGMFTLKIFKSWAPMYAAISQDVTGLQVGRRYRLIAPVYADIYDWEEGKVRPWNPDDGLVRLGASPVGAGWRDEAAITYSGYFPAAYGQYQFYVYDFTATQADMTVWVEMLGTYPHSNNGFFVDIVELRALDEYGSVSGGVSSQPAGPTWTPIPTPTPRSDGAVVHIVGGADSFWSIAIQYAETLGMTPEEALPFIQELNDNPRFIFAGQELLIVPPNESAPEPTAEPTTDPAAGEPAEEATTPTPEAEATPESEATPTAVPVVIESDQTGTGAVICVSAYEDVNFNGEREAEEKLLGDVVFTISRPTGTVVTYVSDGISEPECFENLPADTYQVEFTPPDGYAPTTPTNWALTMADGVNVGAEFGAQPAVDSAAAVAAVTETPESSSAAADATVAENAAGESDGGFASNIGGFAIGAAVLLILLAGAGVILLRRS